jgi:hypothetical protein
MPTIIIALLFFASAYVVLVNILTYFLREFHLRNVISSYPKSVFQAREHSLAMIEKPFSELMNHISPRKPATKSYQRSKFFSKIKSIAERRPLGFDFVASHYPASLGNLSEVARRKFTSDESRTDSIRIEAYNLYNALQHRDDLQILNSIANTYRLMKDVSLQDAEINQKIEIQAGFRKLLEKIREDIEALDVFRAYIDLISIENDKSAMDLRLADFNDKELIAYATLKIRLESFFQSYSYPVDKKNIEEKLSDSRDLINYIINKSSISANYMIRNFC